MGRATTQAEILRAVKDRLIQKVPSLNKDNLILSAEPSPPVFPTHKHFVTIAPTDGTFDQEMLDGGGRAQCEEITGIVVTMFYRTQLDRNNHSENLILLDSESLLEQKRQILDALAVHDLSVGQEKILTEPMKPLNSVGTTVFPAPDKLGFTQLFFSTNFFWKLTTDTD